MTLMFQLDAFSAAALEDKFRVIELALNNRNGVSCTARQE